MALIKVTDIDNLLKPYGYERKWYDSIYGWIQSIDYMKEGVDDPITLSIKYDEDYEEELCHVEEEVETDFSRCNATVICIPSQIVTETGFIDGSKDGIVLSISSLNEDEKYHTQDLTIENIKKALWINEHLDEHECFIMKKHIENIQDIRNRLEKFNKQYNYICKFNPIFGCREERENSHLYLYYEGDYYGYEIGTNAFDGEVYVDHNKKIDLKTISDKDLLALTIPVDEIEKREKAGYPKHHC